MRRICVITGSRAEYYLLYPLLKLIKESKKLELQLIVTGSHISDKLGNSYLEIEKEFRIDSLINIDIDKNETSDSFALAIKYISKSLKLLSPDIVLLLGDRYEILAAATSAVLNNIPIAHIHGGESTFGAQDEAFRHSITKMSQIHFTSTDKYKKRVIQLGENPNLVFNVGSLGVECVSKIELLSKEEIENKLGFEFKKRNILLTFHPETISNKSPSEQFQTILRVLDRLENTRIIITKANSDEGGKIINDMIDKYALTNKDVVVFTTMGMLNYFSTIKYVDCVVGNSSSGIIEVPSFNKITVNIGDRQAGRISADSVFDVDFNEENIYNAIVKTFDEKRLTFENPYYQENTAEKILNVLENSSIELKKVFFDL